MQLTDQYAAVNDNSCNRGNQPDVATNTETPPHLPCFLHTLMNRLKQTLSFHQEAINTLIKWPQALGYDQAVTVTLKPDCILLNDHASRLQQQIEATLHNNGHPFTTHPTTQSPSPLIIAASPDIAATFNSQGIPALWITALEATCFTRQEEVTFILPQITGIELRNLPEDRLVEQTVISALHSTLAEHNIHSGVLEFYGPATEQLTGEQRLAICNALLIDGYQGFFPATDCQTTQTLPTNASAYSNALSVVLSAVSEPAALESDPESPTRPMPQADFTAASFPLAPDRLTDKKPVILIPEHMNLQRSQTFIRENTDCAGTILLAGKHFGRGSPELQETCSLYIRSLGSSVVIAESFNHRFRTLLIDHGIYPFEFLEGDSWAALEMDPADTITLDIPDEIYPYEPVVMTIQRHNGRRELVELTLRLDNEIEIQRHSAGGILQQQLPAYASAPKARSSDIQS